MPDSNISDSPLPGLYIVATPIGNLGDIGARAARTLASADVIAAEDTRVTAKLLSHLGLRVPMTPYHDHSDERTRATLVARMEAEIVVLVSDAGNRSEEHTSELKSLMRTSYAVLCLKKKHTNN